MSTIYEYNDKNALDIYIYTRPEIIKCKSRPYHMNNLQLAEYYVSKLRNEFPDVQLVEISGQFICLNQKHIQYVKNLIKKSISAERLEISRLESLLSEL